MWTDVCEAQSNLTLRRSAALCVTHFWVEPVVVIAPNLLLLTGGGGAGFFTGTGGSGDSESESSGDNEIDSLLTKVRVKHYHSCCFLAPTSFCTV